MSNKYSQQQQAAQNLRKAQKEIENKQKACTNKTAYPTHELAIQKGQSAYKCEYCGFWHRTSKVSKFVRNIVARKPLGPKKKKKRKGSARTKTMKLNGKRVPVKRKH